MNFRSEMHTNLNCMPPVSCIHFGIDPFRLRLVSEDVAGLVYEIFGQGRVPPERANGVQDVAMTNSKFLVWPVFKAQPLDIPLSRPFWDSLDEF